MTGPNAGTVAHLDDHVLVVRDRALPGPRFEALCPHVGDAVERRALCAYSAPCGCQARYDADHAAVAKLLGRDVEDEPLELRDWIDGVSIPLGSTRNLGLLAGGGEQVPPHLTVTVPPHERCANSGLRHGIDPEENEVVTATGACAVQGEVGQLGWDVLESTFDGVQPAPGRYPVTFNWDEGINVYLAGPLLAALS